jgi:CRP-like cAMP-binding protein
VLQSANDAVKNRLLGSISADVRSRLQPEVRRVELRRGEVILESGAHPACVYFPLPGTMISLVVTSDDGTGVEVGVAGNEGMVGISALLGSGPAPHHGVTQIPGEAIRIRTEAILREFDRDARLRELLLRYANYLIAQASQTALCNRLHPVEERLARWLLICHDRSGSDNMQLTHELLSQMLGTRRSTVSISASMLQTAGLIRYLHGKVTILNRRGLEQASCGCYTALVRQSQFNGA